MSKNFELMHEAGIRLDLPPVEDSKPGPAPSFNVSGQPSPIGPRNGTQFNLTDKLTREETSKLVQNLFLMRGADAPRVVIFAGIDPGNGCSSICAHVADVLASQRLGSVCMVDANLRTPALPEIYGVSNHYGLTDALSKKGSIRDFAKLVRSDNLWLLSCGSLAADTADSPAMMSSETMRMRIAELRKEFDYVLIDSAPLSTYADGVVLGQLADGLVLVLEANSTRREAATRVTEHLRAAQVRILGAVLNKRTFPIPGSVYDLL
jgi:capsular exopolysaccharide synthesis family protein